MKKVIISIIITALASSGFAETNKGTSSGLFLNVSAGARAQGLGGGYTAISDDLTALYWNPAGLALLKRPEVFAQHTEYVSDVNHEYLALSYPIWGFGTIATGITLLYSQDEYRINPGIKTGTFQNRDFAWSVAYGHTYNNDLRFGVTGKLIHRKLATYSTYDGAVDLGVHFQADRYLPGLSAGLSISNVGTHVKFIDSEDPLPLTLRFGAAWKTYFNRLTFTAELEKIRDDDVRGHFGAEFLVHPAFALRVGYEAGHDFKDAEEGLKGGAGFKYGDFNLDYAFELFGEFGTIHRVSSGYKFGTTPEDVARLRRPAKTNPLTDFFKRVVPHKKEKPPVKPPPVKYVKKSVRDVSKTCLLMDKFENFTDDNEFDWLVEAVPQVLTEELIATGRVDISNQISGCDYVFSGGFTRDGDMFYFISRLQDINSKETIKIFEQEVPEDKIFDAISELKSRLVEYFKK